MQTGDFVSMDFVGSTEDGPLDGASGSDYVLQVGSGRLVPGLRGEPRRTWRPAKRRSSQSRSRTTTADPAAERRTPTRARAPKTAAARLAALRGAPVTFTVNVKEIKEKVVPELVGRLRQGRQRVRDARRAAGRRAPAHGDSMQEQAAEREFRAGVVEAVADAATSTVPLGHGRPRGARPLPRAGRGRRRAEPHHGRLPQHDREDAGDGRRGAAAACRGERAPPSGARGRRRGGGPRGRPTTRSASASWPTPR